MVSISPQVALYLNIAYGVLTGLTVGALEATGLSHGDSGHIVAIAGLIAVPLNIYLHAVSSSDAGPLAK